MGWVSPPAHCVYIYYSTPTQKVQPFGRLFLVANSQFAQLRLYRAQLANGIVVLLTKHIV